MYHISGTGSVNIYGTSDESLRDILILILILHLTKWDLRPTTREVSIASVTLGVGERDQNIEDKKRGSRRRWYYYVISLIISS